ncbi:hypothetical protein Droror1_Dr00027080 [Drosera rotundifolia]
MWTPRAPHTPKARSSQHSSQSVAGEKGKSPWAKVKWAGPVSEKDKKGWVHHRLIAELLLFEDLGVLYRYLWTSVVDRELATLAFYIFTRCKFKPEAHNPYFAIDDEGEEAAIEQLKLEDEFEL